jgi:hypothetical protein
VAVNCCVAPTATVAVAGVTVTDNRVGGGGAALVTVSIAVPLTPFRDAVMVVAPEATAVASPLALMVATLAVELVHEAVAVTLPVEPSL